MQCKYYVIAAGTEQIQVLHFGIFWTLKEFSIHVLLNLGCVEWGLFKVVAIMALILNN